MSTPEQSPSSQLTELYAAAIRRGWNPETYIDTGTGKRGAALPTRQRLMDDARAGKLAAVMVWRFDRFARSTTDLVNALESFRAWGVDFISLTEGVDTSTPTGKMVFTIIAALAEFERNLIGERVRAGIAARKAQGRTFGRPVKVVPVAAARRYLTQGRSLRWTAVKIGVSARTLTRALETTPLTIPEERRT